MGERAMNVTDYDVAPSTKPLPLEHQLGTTESGIASRNDSASGGKIGFMDQNNKLDAEYALPGGGSNSNASWVHAAFHNVTAMVGAGVLGLPNAMVRTLMTAMSLYTGPRLGLWTVIPCQLIVMIGLDIVYCVTAGKAMYYVYQHTCDGYETHTCRSFGLSCWIVIFAVIQMFLSMVPNFHKLSAISLLAAVMSISYSTIAIGVSAHAGRQPGAEYNLNGFTKAEGVFGIFNALGTIAFAYGGHNVVLEIQSTIPSNPKAGVENPTAKPMMTGSQIMYSLGHPIWVICVAEIMIIIHVCGSFQVYAMPVYDMIEYQLVKRRVPNGFPTRLVYRTVYIIIVAFIGMTIPFFGDLLGFIGALGFGPSTYCFPSMFWLAIKKPGPTSWHFWASWFCILCGVIITLLGAIGGMQGIIVDASTYKFYQ
ncbi:MAG: Lysine histidine transporter 1 [Trebouxia sp. A1-2]|nr:MAG: Lysine histidine transporter 1 [Trebouxia sp. A1-2]